MEKLLNKELQWLLKNREFLNIKSIEKAIGMPDNTIRKFVSGERGVPDNWIEPVSEWVKKFKK